MNFRPFRTATLAGALLLGTGGAVLAQGGSTQPTPGHAPGLSTPAPSVDTGKAGTDQYPVHPTTDPNATGSTPAGSAANPPGHPPGTIPAGPDAAIGAGVSGRNTCYPGQSGKPTGSTNPSGMPSQC